MALGGAWGGVLAAGRSTRHVPLTVFTLAMEQNNDWRQAREAITVVFMSIQRCYWCDIPVCLELNVQPYTSEQSRTYLPISRMHSVVISYACRVFQRESTRKSCAELHHGTHIMRRARHDITSFPHHKSLMQPRLHSKKKENPTVKPGCELRSVENLCSRWERANRQALLQQQLTGSSNMSWACPNRHNTADVDAAIACKGEKGGTQWLWCSLDVHQNVHTSLLPTHSVGFQLDGEGGESEISLDPMDTSGLTTPPYTPSFKVKNNKDIPARSEMTTDD
ncbi:hypothetical protein Bbelb_437040 [Branchiostoma belcheri]|nr:hypothetical protein Bbelb_437040 [Branchiostoma belcheri]